MKHLNFHYDMINNISYKIFRIRIIAQQLSKKEGFKASPSWIDGFIKRHKEISVRRSQNFEVSRAIGKNSTE